MNYIICIAIFGIIYIMCKWRVNEDATNIIADSMYEIADLFEGSGVSTELNCYWDDAPCMATFTFKHLDKKLTVSSSKALSIIRHVKRDRTYIEVLKNSLQPTPPKKSLI